MNKKIEQYFSQKGFNLNKNYGYGQINGYEVNLLYNSMNNVAPVSFIVSFFALENDKMRIIEELNNANIKFLQYQSNELGMIFGINDFTVGALIKKLDSILDTIFTILKNNNALPQQYCPICGKELLEDFKLYRVNDCNYTLHNECANEIKDSFEEENQEYVQMPNNYLKGFFGALIGAGVGAISFIIIFFLGFISSISSFISVFLGSFLYKKFGGKPNYIMVIMTSVLTIVILLLTVYLLYGLAAVGYSYEEGLTLSMGEAFKHMMNNSDFASEFTTNIIMTLLFAIIGAGYEVYGLIKGLHKKQTIK